MKQFFINLGLVYLGGFSFYCAVMLYFNRPSLRHQLAVLHNVNDENVAYSNRLNSTIRDLRDAAVEQGNLISMYDEAADDSRREIERITNRNAWQAKTIKQAHDQVAHHEITINEYRKLLKDAQVAVCDAQTEIRNAQEALEFLKSELEMAERRLVQLRLEHEATVSYYKQQVAGSTRV